MSEVMPSLQTGPAAFRNKLDHSLPKMTTPGSLHLDETTCGKPTCQCTRGILHGPYVNRRWRKGPSNARPMCRSVNSSEFWPKSLRTHPALPSSLD